MGKHSGYWSMVIGCVERERRPELPRRRWVSLSRCSANPHEGRKADWYEPDTNGSANCAAPCTSGGICSSNGTCVCKTGFTGSRCGEFVIRGLKRGMHTSRVLNSHHCFRNRILRHRLLQPFMPTLSSLYQRRYMRRWDIWYRDLQGRFGRTRRQSGQL